MEVENRRDQEKQERHDSILDAAEQIFFSKGYERCSMDEIARTARVSRALLYVYFTDKAAIMRGVALRACWELHRRFEKAITDGQSGMEQIENIGRAYYQFSHSQPDYFDVLTQIQGFILQGVNLQGVNLQEGNHSAEVDALSAALLERSERIMQLLAGALTQGVADGTICRQRAQHPLKTAYYLRGAMHGVIMQCRHIDELRLPDHPAPEALVDYTLQMLSHSLQP